MSVNDSYSLSRLRRNLLCAVSLLLFKVNWLFLEHITVHRHTEQETQTLTFNLHSLLTFWRTEEARTITLFWMLNVFLLTLIYFSPIKFSSCKKCHWGIHFIILIINKINTAWIVERDSLCLAPPCLVAICGGRKIFVLWIICMKYFKIDTYWRKFQLHRFKRQSTGQTFFGACTEEAMTSLYSYA